MRDGVLRLSSDWNWIPETGLTFSEPPTESSALDAPSRNIAALLGSDGCVGDTSVLWNSPCRGRFALSLWLGMPHCIVSKIDEEGLWFVESLGEESSGKLLWILWFDRWGSPLSSDPGSWFGSWVWLISFRVSSLLDSATRTSGSSLGL